MILPQTGGPLHLKNIQPDDQGEYKCIGTNTVGSADISYTVDVLGNCTQNQQLFESQSAYSLHKLNKAVT